MKLVKITVQVSDTCQNNASVSDTFIKLVTPWLQVGDTCQQNDFQLVTRIEKYRGHLKHDRDIFD